MSSTAPVRRASLGRLAPPSGAGLTALGRARLSVVPRLRSRAPKVPFVTLVSVLLLGGVIGLLLFNTSMQQASFDVSRLQSQADTLTAQQQALQDDVDALDDPTHIAAMARRNHMVYPPNGTATVNLDKATVTGTTPPAVRGDQPPVFAATPPPAAPVTAPPRAPTDPTSTTRSPVVPTAGGGQQKAAGRAKKGLPGASPTGRGPAAAQTGPSRR